YCTVVLRVVGAHRGGKGRFVMPPTLDARALGSRLAAHAREQGRRLASIEWQALLLVPYWRARGMSFRWLYCGSGRPPAPPAVAATPRRGLLARFGGLLAAACLLGDLGTILPEGPVGHVPLPASGVAPSHTRVDDRVLQARHFDVS